MKKRPEIYYLVALIGVSFFALILGFVVDAQSFLVNLLASLPAAALGVWVSIAIIQDILDRRQSNEWLIVRKGLILQIFWHLTQAASCYIAHTRSLSIYINLTHTAQEINIEQANLALNLCTDFEDMKDEVTREDLDQLHSLIKGKTDRIKDLVLLYMTIPGHNPESLYRLQVIESIVDEWDQKVTANRTNRLSNSVFADKACQTLSGIAELMVFLSTADRSF